MRTAAHLLVMPAVDFKINRRGISSEMNGVFDKHIDDVKSLIFISMMLSGLTADGACVVVPVALARKSRDRVHDETRRASQGTHGRLQICVQ